MTTATATAQFTVAKLLRGWSVVEGGRVVSTHKTKAAAQLEADAENAAWEAEHDAYAAPAKDAEQIAIEQNAHSEDPEVDPNPLARYMPLGWEPGARVVCQNTIPVLAPYSEMTADEIAAMDTVERLTAAKVETLALRAWKADGADEAVRPATPIIDWMANPGNTGAAARKARKTTGGTTRTSTATFDATTVQTHTCSVCATEKPVTQFPTISGKPGVRGCRCRQCRDAKPTS